VTKLAALWRENRGTILFLAIIALAFLVLRSKPTEGVSVEGFMDELSTRSATVAYFYSNT